MRERERQRGKEKDVGTPRKSGWGGKGETEKGEEDRKRVLKDS